MQAISTDGISSGAGPPQANKALENFQVLVESD